MWKGICSISQFKTQKLCHSGEKSFKCDLCEDAFAQLHHLKGYKLSHTGEKSFNCGLWKNIFTTMPELTNHKYLEECLN